MDQFKSTFIHFPQYRIIVCRSCRSGVIPAHISTHLNSHHNGLLPKTRKEIARIVESITDLAKKEEEVVYPASTSDHIPELELWKDGFKCTAVLRNSSQCRHIYRGIQNIHKHCRVQHGWTNPRKRGRVTKGQEPEDTKMWVDSVHCQRFFVTGGFQRLFEVEQKEEESEGEMDLNRTIIQQGQKDFQSSWAELEEEKKKRVIDCERSRYEPNAWLDRTGWVEHLAGIEREWLHGLTRSAEEREKALKRVCQAIDRVIFKAQKASQPKVVGWPAINYINRREHGGESNEKPFYTHQMAKTIAKYASVWTTVFCYIWRSHALAEIRVDIESDSEEEEGEESRRRRKPGYRLTIGQERRMSKIKELVRFDDESRSERDWSLGGSSTESESGDEEESEEEKEELEGRVLSFLMELLDHNVKDSEYASALVSGLAVLGLDEQCGWMSPSRYTPILSAIVTVAKMLVLYQAKMERTEEVEQLMGAHGWDRETAKSKAPAHFDLVREMARRFLQLTDKDGNPSPIDWVLRLRAYGRKIRDHTTEDGVIDWIGDQVSMGHVSFTMADMRSMIHGLVETARAELYKELLLLDVDGQGEIIPGQATQLPTIPWADLVDNPAEASRGWSLFKDGRNKLNIDGTTWLYDRVLKERELRDGFVDVDATIGSQSTEQAQLVWKTRRLRAYEKSMRLYKEHLLVLMHLSGGQPGRGTELVSVQYKNSENGSIRGVFVENGLMVFVTGYHKGFGLSAKTKIIHRYLPREVGTLLFYYLWLVKPFWEAIEVVSEGRREESSPFIWEPKPEPKHERDDEKEKNESLKRSRARREGSERFEGEEVREENEPISSQSQSLERHKASGVIGFKETWDTDKIRRAIQRVTLQWMGVKVSVMAWRHISIAIFRRYSRNGRVQKALDDEEMGTEDDEAADLQAGHGSKMAANIYARELTESPFHTASRRAAFRHVSQEWHRLLLFGSALEASAARGPMAMAMRREAIEEEFRRWRQMRAVDIQEQLVHLVGEGSRFRGIQEPALEAIMRQKSPIVGIMGTGSGKSLLFMLPAACSAGVTVVVVPLISLREDLKNRCYRAGIECVEWSSRKPHEWASIVLVTPESAVSESFGNFINRQRAMGRLDRIVVDECHVVLDSKGGWRTRMLALRDLIKTETQLVYLTATMPPSEEEEFIQLMGLPSKERGLWFRGSTTRKNIEYRVMFHDRKEEEEAVVGLVEQKKVEYPMPGGQIIIYCDTVKKAERLAEVLGCVCFHRNVGSRGEKSGILRQLTEGRQQVFTATNALGLGVDAPTIRVVIHVGRVRKLRDYAQESGRAGRDGLKSEAIILQPVGYNERGETIDTSSWMEENMRRFVMDSGCMRVILDEVMDGRVGRRGCEEGEERCNNCIEEAERRGDYTNVEVIDRAVEEEEIGLEAGGDRVEFERDMRVRRMMKQEELSSQRVGCIEEVRLEEVLAEWSIGCVLCRGHWEVGDEEWKYWDHSIEKCGRDIAEKFRVEVKRMEEEIVWENWSGCSECRVAQGICDRWEDRVDSFGWKRSGLDCQYRGVLVGAVAGLWYVGDKIVDGWICEESRVNSLVSEDNIDGKWKVIFSWLGRKVRIGRLEGSNLCRVLCKFG